jgi:hypothetical protein
MLSFIPHHWDKVPYDLVDPWEFEDTLKFKGIGYRGHGDFITSKDNEVTIFGSDVDKVIMAMTKGVIRGKWRTVKRGNSIGLMPVELYE